MDVEFKAEVKVQYCPERWPRSLGEHRYYTVYHALGDFSSS